MRVGEADVRPRRTGIGGFVNAIAFGLLAGADVDDICVRKREGHGSHRSDVLSVENRFPDDSAVSCLPHAAARRSDVIDRWISGNACYCRDASCSVGTNQTPAHRAEETWINLLRIQLTRAREQQGYATEGEAG